MTRIALLHTGAVVIAPITAATRAALPDATLINYLDDRIVADLGDEMLASTVPDRLVQLGTAARHAGAEVMMLTCSSISGFAADTARRVGIPVLRIDEAMADEAVIGGERVAVVATLPTTLTPTIALLHERAALANAAPTIDGHLVEGAFAAVAGGDRATHDALVADAVRRVAADADVVVLAQASMASVAEAASVDVPVLTSIEPGIARLGEVVGSLTAPNGATKNGGVR